MARLIKRVGRFEFVLRILAITALGCALTILLPRDLMIHMRIVSRYLYTCEEVLIFGLVGIYLLEVIDGRLLDTGLSHWYRYPAFIVWLLSTSLLFIWPRSWPISFILFALLLFTGGRIPSKSAQVKPYLSEMIERSFEKTSALESKSPSWNVSPIGFLRTLLTIGCLGFPLILLDSTSSHGVGVWIARLGYFILGIVSLTNISSRLEDAGWSPHLGKGFLIVVGVFLIELFHRYELNDQASLPHEFSVASGAHFATVLPSWAQHINGYEILAFFLLIQAPLAFLPRKHGPARQEDRPKKWKRITTWRGREVGPFLVGPVAFLRRLIVIAVLWTPLIYMDDASNGNIGTWLARLGYFILAFAWLMNADGRFEDAGWGFNWAGKQYALVVSVASLMPLWVHWVSGYGALLIFALIQLPTVFLKSKPQPEGPLPDGTSLDESQATAPRS